jgi:hypothetical protein
MTATLRQYLYRHRGCDSLVGDIASDVLADPSAKGLSGYRSLLRIVNQHNLRDEQAVEALTEADKRFRASPEGPCEVEGPVTHCQRRLA